MEDFLAKVAEILQNWKNKNIEACERGTKIHRAQELRLLGGDDTEIKKYGLGGKFNCYSDNKLKIGDKGVYPELLLSRISDDGVLRIAGQADLVIIDEKDVYVLDFKGLPLDTPIATKTGWKLMNDLEIGDEVFDRYGKLTKIKHVSSIHHNPCYKISFDNSESIICDHEHKWVIAFRRSKGKYKEVEMTTEELKTYLENIPKRDSNTIPRILNPRPIDLPDAELPIDPYVLGAWLGDGSKDCGMISNINPDFWEEVRNRGYKVGED